MVMESDGKISTRGADTKILRGEQGFVMGYHQREREIRQQRQGRREKGARNNFFSPGESIH